MSASRQVDACVGDGTCLLIESNVVQLMCAMCEHTATYRRRPFGRAGGGLGLV